MASHTGGILTGRGSWQSTPDRYLNRVAQHPHSSAVALVAGLDSDLAARCAECVTIPNSRSRRRRVEAALSSAVAGAAGSQVPSNALVSAAGVAQVHAVPPLEPRRHAIEELAFVPNTEGWSINRSARAGQFQAVGPSVQSGSEITTLPDTLRRRRHRVLGEEVGAAW